jgi:hypothetical protein
MLTINLSGPDGNAYVLLGYAKSTAKELGVNPTPILEDMMTGDYHHLLRVFESNFGTMYKLKNKPKSYIKEIP